VSARQRPLRPAGPGIRAIAEGLAPAGTLGSVQAVWEQAAGAAIAEQARPTGEAGGVLTVTCSSAVWAQELELMSTSLIERLNAALGEDRIASLRCQSVPARRWSEGDL
jgi:predicted nucleic acid-binding Zn ribbon protein